MDILLGIVLKVATKYSLITAFVVVGGMTWVSYFASKYLTKGRG